jgi:hypothetical protein
VSPIYDIGSGKVWMMKELDNENRIEHRVEKRQDSSEGIFFATRSSLYEGELKDYSRKGLFIKTDEFLPLLAIITVKNPNPEGADEKRKGQILWRNIEGFGVELYRSRNERESQVTRIEQRSINRDL